jgi:predicted nuclease of predicted toxin-antitoxin system
MRFLADENCDFAVVRALRAAGHDVRALTEETTRTVDSEIVSLAGREKRILLTEDKDFGWLAFVADASGDGVILVRFPGQMRSRLGGVVCDLVAEQGDKLRDSFTVVQPGQIRITPRRRWEVHDL